MKNICHNIVSNKYFDIISNILTFIAVFSFMLSTELKAMDYYVGYIVLEVGLFFCFLSEYILRIIASDHSFKKIFKPLMIIDLIVLCSFLLPVRLFQLRFTRLLKLFTLLKHRRYKHAIHTIVRVCKAEKESFIVIGVFFFILILISSSLMCLIEGAVQDKFSSILKSMWWATMTSTSVGYGDVVPITTFGKLIASFTAIFGILLYSMLTALFTSGFSRELKKVQKLNK